jgi:hypothetical protein
VKWLMGEDISGLGAIRSMSDPTAYGDPDKMSSAYYFTGTGDNGGVHYNSGINNKAAYLMTDGASFNGHNVTGIGIDKVAAIYYDVQTSMLTSGSDYGDLYNALYQSCIDLIGGSEGITSGDCDEVRDATDAVEMNDEPEPGFNPDAELCTGGEDPWILFSDDIESGTGNWTAAAIEGYSSWYDIEGYAHSGVTSLYGDDYWADYYATPSDSYMAMNLDVTLPIGDGPYLWFAHAFGFDPPDWDGGWVEYSTNGGVSWTDAGSLIDSGLDYTGTINDTWNNPNPGQAAYVDTSHGYVSTRVDLSSLSGHPIRFRWRMSSDDVVYDLGWLVDDVMIYTCDPPLFAPTDFDGDSRTDPAKFSSSSNTLSYLKSSTGTWQDVAMGAGTIEYVPRSDFDGDLKTDPAMFVPAAGSLWYRESSSSTWQGVYTGPGSYELVTGSDFDGDGKTDPALFYTVGGANALWYLKSTTSTWQGVYMGPGSYELVMGSDFDGDGKTDPALFYSVGGANALWYLESSSSTWRGVYMGPGTYEMVPASDFDGDGKTDPALFYAAGGANALWYLESSTATWKGVYMGAGTYSYVSGADFDGDGKTDPAEFVSGTKTMWWLKSTTSSWDGVWMGAGTYEVVN